MSGETRKQVLVISRHWHSPEITVTIRDENIELECALDDFIRGLVSELRHPLASFTKGRMAEDLIIAKSVVLEKIKHASTHAV